MTEMSCFPTLGKKLLISKNICSIRMHQMSIISRTIILSTSLNSLSKKLSGWLD
jgi:hypothetical protein